MKKIKHLLVLVAALAPLSLAAQTGLAVNRVFQAWSYHKNKWWR